MGIQGLVKWEKRRKGNREEKRRGKGKRMAGRGEERTER